ncbi:bifunctional methylenetetrahydrofolate dehydrogenase/methenyltetrahydrofolate cyclohydrolase FolD [Burkholderia sp. Ac-20353]|uniref:bifunctional methylenetetrahydrofolate dehydrogenase/methenyltetrahydrofolate cyclohydrolase FolD n=1 Tax=Burkholderia sp. Ac-20353 TaxID=2703894 RepID=UPI00197B6C94|nr:bifunctional methylenetetrahydrofolate dehydrogenase/methenyltetrahydrofolate cyclohydrolase FolD [Burkholderia sp. Ac-20353]MBN3786558.1 bifunctional methylenetetrahydrofolate dehydrogenase/methenyltetrahydrofolate cyclohydrolase FolD [Burkholderia sp. Ac-20353]
MESTVEYRNVQAKLVDGRALATAMRAKFRERAQFLASQGIVPGLAVILVGDDPASQVYVNNKTKACSESGIRSMMHRFGADCTEADLLDTIASLNANAMVHGILVQLPLPVGINVRRVIEAIAVDKDVDGFHLYNVGALVVGDSIFPPCTPYGVQLLLDTTNIDVSGKDVVVVGASNIVGKPMALMLLQREATVTVCHIKTRDLKRHTREADVLIVAAGKPGLITGDMVKDGAIVIDVGINRLADGSIVGDVDFSSVSRRASWITPVPGGVGPMTVTMLLENTLRSAERYAKLEAFHPDQPFWEVPAK